MFLGVQGIVRMKAFQFGKSAEFYPAATDYIAAMIAMIEKLLEKKVAYQGKNGDIFFAIAKFS